MNTNLANIEAHMQYVTTKQLQESLMREQLRLAKANRPGTVRTMLANALISIGERLQAGHDALEAEQLRKARARTA